MSVFFIEHLLAVVSNRRDVPARWSIPKAFRACLHLTWSHQRKGYEQIHQRTVLLQGRIGE